MAKNFDGIKKLNSEEAEKYREIVLNYIGEARAAKTSKLAEKGKNKQTIQSSRLIDGIKLTAARPAMPPAVEQDRLKQAIKRQAEMRKQAEAEDRRLMEQANIERQARGQAVKQENLKKKETILRLKREAEEKKRREEARRWEEKIKLEEREREEKRLADEEARREKIKRGEEVKKVRQERKAARQISREKARAKRRKTLGQYKEKLNSELRVLSAAVRKNYLYIALFFLFFSVTAYLALCAAVLRFGLGDRLIIKQLASAVPVPAVITSQGVINYYDYQNISNNHQGLTAGQKKNFLARWLLERNLRRKYGMPAGYSANAEDLAAKFVLDQDFNLAGWSRINKILKLAASQNQLKELGRYSDQYNAGAYFSDDEAAQKFGPGVLQLKAGQLSRVIARPDGYYLVKKIGDQANRLGLEYVFIGARTLEQYLGGKSAQINALILAD